MATMAAIFDIETEQSNSSRSPCRPNASHHVSAQSNLIKGVREDVVLKNLKMDAILDIGEEQF